MFLDPTLLSSGATSDEEGVDTVADGGNEDVVGFKDDPDDDNDADDDEDDEKNDEGDCKSDDAVATDVFMVIIDKDGDEDDDSAVGDCSSGVSVGGCKILPLKCDETETKFGAPSLNIHLTSFVSLSRLLSFRGTL